MTFPVTIFVEGKSDKRFISHFIQRRFGVEPPTDGIQVVEGCDRLTAFVERFRISSDQGLRNLVIFDSDLSFASKQQSLDVQKAQHSIEFDSFLFPNNRDNGALEDLLEQIVPENNRYIFGCFDRYLECLRAYNTDNLNLPPMKTKIFAYTELLNQPSKIDQRDYLNEQVWDLHSPAVLPLFQFLETHFQ